MPRLEGKVALISGGARGQGAVEARMFAGEGAKELVSEVFSRTNVVIKTASNYGRLLVGNTILSSMAPIIRMSL